MSSTFLFLGLLLLSNPVFADDFGANKVDEGGQYLHAALGFGQGGIAMGADYENGLEASVGWGGLFRFYSGLNATTGSEPRIFFLGGFVRPHWNRNKWDFYFSPGIGFSMIKLTTPVISDSETLLTPIFSIGTSWAFSNTMSIGMESTTIYGITSDQWRGPISQDVMAKFKISLN